MPNWCSASVSVNSDKAKLIYDELLKATDGRYKKIVESDFGNNWLGNLLLHIGYKKDDVVNGDIMCRGCINGIFEGDEKSFGLTIESAWGPHIKCIENFAKWFDQDAEVIYSAEEFGVELFWTNDSKVVETKCFVDTDAWDVDGMDYGFDSDIYDIVEVKSALYKLYPNATSFSDAVNRYNDELQSKAPDHYFCVHEYEFVEIDDGC